jgi:alpha-tubulin suppressor-like RCC1 family protein
MIRFVYILPIKCQIGIVNPDGFCSDKSTPTLVPTLSNIKYIYAGVNKNSFFIDNNNIVYVVGPNEESRLGIGNNQDIKIPTINKYLSNITEIAAGGRHTMALVSNGSVLVFGGNNVNFLTRIY